MSKVIPIAEVKKYLFDGMSIMSGGFMGVGTSAKLVQAILDSGIKDITLICSDTATIETGVGPLIAHNRVKKVIASHIGTNPETGKKMISGEIEVELVPQGTFAERVRAGGAGLGGFLTPTGVGTVVEEGKQKIQIDGKDFLLELPLKADLAIIKADTADEAGNLIYQGAARNFNPLMALAGKVVMVEAAHIVKTGELDPNLVMTPATLVDFLVS
ncbi:acetate CoA-transferase subunit alpha [Actinobacillus equuli subsp. equuli]|uniref:Acetate CoA-transferase subunit alpha n=1 Tax=Actinobacillus equuli TaxID=718 RepID=A0AAX3FIU9_ACTEU|nr:acetate CoA-transferase subunit alpha [Actinobacillus equuli]AIZ79765.1 acetyl-CoA:acetoacetyl-CoA transferase subunit alpha [Actinobacillus equuli subsp. equuli]WGE43876.1 acetate CoA-transferase subunit alpha [Actinobacillus equuli subsp. equuli]WGE54506.1 acetate CoA-transferase subunit alpha [Actinobacillus equuli subsp. equuli]WGE56582.1 acetate CoA-transferase subunit alpha [Actinobacillus equuli subsp. equuli]WGE78759.1 acetate CoA-transferase subunit alpha [Actinobacillus equuli sub